MADRFSANGTRITANQSLVLGQSSFKRTDDGTTPLNVDGRASGAITTIWNGTGGSDTGGDWTRSGVGSETAGSAHAGTNGLDTAVMANDDDVIFTNGADIDPEDFSQVSFWIQPKVFPGNAQPRIRWATIADSNVGDQLDLNDYVTNWDLDVWQKITIPMADFAIDVSDDIGKLKFEFHNSGQHVWLDDLQMSASGGDGPFTFQVAAPDALTIYHVSMVVLVVSDTGANWNSTTFAGVSALENGVLLRQRRISDGEILWSINSKDNIDLFGRFHPQDTIEFADGTLLVGFMIKPGKASAIITNDEVLEFLVRDDLSGLTSARAFVHYGVEVIS